MKITQPLGLSYRVTVGGHQVLAAGVSWGLHKRRGKVGFLKGGCCHAYHFSEQGEISKAIGVEEEDCFQSKSLSGTGTHSPDWCRFLKPREQLSEQPLPSWACEFTETHLSSQAAPPSPCLRRSKPILACN